MSVNGRASPALATFARPASGSVEPLLPPREKNENRSFQGEELNTASRGFPLIQPRIRYLVGGITQGRTTKLINFFGTQITLTMLLPAS